MKFPYYKIAYWDSRIINERLNEDITSFAPLRGLPAGGGGVPRSWGYGGDSPHLHDPSRVVDPRWHDLGHVISHENHRKQGNPKQKDQDPGDPVHEAQHPPVAPRSKNRGPTHKKNPPGKGSCNDAKDHQHR